MTVTSVLVAGDEIKLPPFIVNYKELYKNENSKNYSVRKTETKSYTNDDKKQLLDSIIYENKDFFVINKPSGIASQGGTGILKSIDSLVNFARPEFNGNLRLTHRIDKDTSGILVIAKTYDAANKITELFKERKVSKVYRAIVYGNFSKNKKVGVIDSPIIDKNNDEKPAITEYQVIDEAYNLMSLVELSPKTGRTHQLRKHLASIGNSIVGDFKYGDKGQFANLKQSLDIEIPRNLFLHAYSVTIEGYPTIVAPYPAHFKKLNKYLNF